jgi:hypothetical protein
LDCAPPAAHDWLTDMRLVSAGDTAMLDRYVGYYGPYATSHEALDRDRAIQQEVRNVAGALAAAVKAMRRQRPRRVESEDPRPK